MLKIDSKAGDTLQLLIVTPLKIFVPIITVIAAVLNLFSPTGSLSNVVDAALFTAAICVAPGLTLWTIGMAFDLMMVAVKFILQGAVLSLVGAFRAVKRIHTLIQDHRGIRSVGKHPVRPLIDVTER